MTVTKARKLLGNKYSHLTDQEVEFRVKKLSVFADALVDATLEKLATIESNETSNYSSESLLA